MLVKQQAAKNGDANPVQPAKFGVGAGNSKARKQNEAEAEQVQSGRKVKRPTFAEKYRNRIQRLIAVEFFILKCINDVESRNPEQYRAGVQQRNQVETTASRKVGANGRQRKANTQHKMTKPGKSLGVAVAKHDYECHRREVETGFINEPGRCNEQQTVGDYKKQGFAGADNAGRNFALLGARIAAVYVAV